MNCCLDLYRGTTPTLTFNLSIYIMGNEKFVVTFRQHNTIILKKSQEEIIFNGNNSKQFKVKLSQEEALMFSHKYPIEVQIRAKYPDGSAIAANKMEFYLKEILDDEVI